MLCLRCPETGTTYPASRVDFRGPTGVPLDVHFTPASVSRTQLDARLGRMPAPLDSGVWRYHELVQPDLPLDAVVSRPEGNTPLIDDPHVAAWAGLPGLRLKHEGMNPTGSFKDRGMTVAVSMAKQVGARAVVCASTGNTSAAVAAYAARAGMRAIILVPEGQTALGKLGQAIAYGARTLVVRGDFDDAMRLVQSAASDLGLYLLNSLNPFRVMGQTTIIYELLQQLAWDPPDVIVFPAGNLGNTAAFGRALRTAASIGLIDRVPRLIAVQAEGASPFAKAFARGFDRLDPERADTLATAIRIGDPVSYQRAIASIRETNGLVMSVSDREILEAKMAIDAAGVGAEPASCAPVAGLRKLVTSGALPANTRAVAILTGNLLKDPDVILAMHRGEHGALAGRNPPMTIDATLAAIEAVI